MNACIAQGGVHSTFCWNALFGYVLSLLIPRWNNKGFGFLMSHLTLHHILWSDNVWLIGKDEIEIEEMVKDLFLMMGVYGLVWKPGSLLLMRGGAEDNAVEKDMTVRMPSDELQILWKKNNQQIWAWPLTTLVIRTR